MAHRTRGARLKRIAVITAVVVGAAGTLACNGVGGPPVPPQGNGQQAPPPPGSHYSCEIKLDAPQKSRFKGQGMNTFAASIVGTSRAYGDKPPITHVVSLNIKHYQGGDWVVVHGFDGNPWIDCREIPPPRTEPKPAVCIQNVPCVMPGRYRVEALVAETYTDADGTLKTWTVPVEPPSDEVTITC